MAGPRRPEEVATERPFVRECPLREVTCQELFKKGNADRKRRRAGSYGLFGLARPVPEEARLIPRNHALASGLSPKRKQLFDVLFGIPFSGEYGERAECPRQDKQARRRRKGDFLTGSPQKTDQQAPGEVGRQRALRKESSKRR